MDTGIHDSYKENYNATNVTPIEQNYDLYPFDDFAPTLSQCFCIVIFGYLMARFELLSASDVKGVNGFASYFAMPGIICASLADSNFEDFRWELLAGIFLAKLIIFLLVAGFLYYLNGNVGVAGLVAIFCVHSNDLPVGNPLMSSLYKDYRPQMMKYLFLIPAMTVIFFIPIGNVMIELHRSKRNTKIETTSEESGIKQSSGRSLYKRECMVNARGIAKNPVVLATFLGLALNFIFKGRIPEILHHPIKVASATIPGIALCLLGFSLVRKERFLLTSAIVPAAVLVVLKLIFTPILMHAILKLITKESESSRLLTDFALLYGIISPAVAVFQSGLEFRKPLAVMSVALILSSFTCFPISYVVARFTILPTLKMSHYIPQISSILFYTACFSMLCDAIVCFAVIWKRQCQHAPFCYILYLAFTQFITCFGVLLWNITDNSMWALYCKTALYCGGEISGYLWTTTLAVLLVFKEKYSMLAECGFRLLCFVQFSLSVLLTMTVCLLIPNHNVQRMYFIGNMRSHFESLQLLIITILLFISLVVVAICLILYFKESEIITKDLKAFENTVFFIQEKTEDTNCHETMPAGSVKELDQLDESKMFYDEVEMNTEDQKLQFIGCGEWTSQMSRFLLIQALIQFVRFTANIFKLVHCEALEIMIPLEFLQTVLFLGQGLVILLNFGVDVRTHVISLRKWYRKQRHGADATVSSNSKNRDPKEVALFCKQFCTFYYIRCYRKLAKERRWRNTTYPESFWGHQMVDWLISEGLCKDDADAEDRGQKLLSGGVIGHVANRQFYDAPYLYHFVKKSEARQRYAENSN